MRAVVRALRDISLSKKGSYAVTYDREEGAVVGLKLCESNCSSPTLPDYEVGSSDYRSQAILSLS